MGKNERQIDIILEQELEKARVNYHSAKSTILYNIWTVGVQGDQRTYAHPVIIEIIYNRKIVWDYDLNQAISTRITNEVKDAYEEGICPDCNADIPDDVKDGEACKYCGHVFWKISEYDYIEDEHETNKT